MGIVEQKSKVKAYLQINPSCSYQEIAKATGFQATLVSSILRILVRDGEITKQNHVSTTGRPLKNSYRVNTP